MTETETNIPGYGQTISQPSTDAPDAEQKKVTKTLEVQMTVKWVNFTYTAEDVTSGDAALEEALASFKENGVKEFVITANNEECDTLEDIFHVAQEFTKVTDEDGNDVCGWDEEYSQAQWKGDEDEE